MTAADWISNYSDRQTPRFQVLNDDQRRELYLAALECLERVGVLVINLEARQLLAAAGARLEDQRLFIPAHIIQEAVRRAPPAFTLWGRSPAAQTNALQVTPGRAYFGPGPTCTYFQDPETGKRRKARRGDAAATARVCDALEHIDYAMSLSLFDDVTPQLSPVYEYAEMVANTGKPVVAWANDPATLQDIYQIAVAAAGGEQALRGRPIFAYFGTYESPLRHADRTVANMLWAAGHGIPVIYLGGPTVGLESPVTGASALVLFLAAALSGLAIVQLKHPGASMAIGGLPSPMDLRTARPAYGSPEMNLHTAAACELAAYLGLPFMGTAGASESKQVDAQAGAEIAVQILCAALSGAGLVHDVGFLDCADIGSLKLLVLADEIIGMVRRIQRGLEVNRRTIMMELIEKVGPGGHFISEPESVGLCRSEIWVPKLLDRNAHTIWEKKGAHSLEERAAERLQTILRTHQPPPLPPEAPGQIEAILSAAERRLQT